ncbi:Alpha/Beta hydrolase protein [Absidia repens]|uniref:Alpha/Beta hydrolase protein n=1 Tax=Absidia repens TaxID=90262 RepID=A0A1X2II16_9FUNG|nr:Alpha/Beta hydrolase protein [Absidia repens]
MSRKSSMLSTILWVTPIIASTVYSHFKEGPPAKSWTLKHYLLIAVIRSYIIGPASTLTPLQMQRGSLRHVQPVPKNCIETGLTISTRYREQGGQVLGNLFEDRDENLIGWDWRTDRNKSTTEALQGSWIRPILSKQEQDQQRPNKRTLLYLHGAISSLLGKLATLADAQVLAVDYRLAPQHPFPTALEDAIAAYLYLLDPPMDAPFEAIPSSQIVISGDSAGGGLTMALLMVIRDCGLPMPAGAIPISPWVDLTHSLPSCQDNEITDYLPPSFNLFKNRFPLKHHDLLPNLINATISEPDDPLMDEALGQLQLYTRNQCLKHYLVSPLFDRYQWHGLPPLLIQTGDAEQLRDESICASFKATDQFGALPPSLDSTTHLHRLKPTSVTLDLYEDQPHVFQLLLPSKVVDHSIQTMASFLCDITSATTKSLSSSLIPRIDPIHPLTIRSVSFDGQVEDVTEDMLKVHFGDIWQDWKERLENTTLLKLQLEKATNSRL